MKGQLPLLEADEATKLEVRMKKAKPEGAERRRGYSGYTVPEKAKRRILSGERHEIDWKSKAFPESLKLVRNAPERLYVIGDPSALDEGLAVIGARKATPYGLGCARRFSHIAALHGITVISGGAFGCDSQAHEAAISAGGKTVVFFGGGCDQVYPARNFGLFQRVIDAGGAVVSEHSWDEPPLPWMFRERNRLIAGLSKATLVVEAGLPSGTFSTADEALAANRDVLVVPGAITSPTSAGANRLLAQGATPIIDDETFYSALFMLFGVMPVLDPNACEDRDADDPLLAALYANPMRIDEMMELDLVPQSERFDALTELTVRLAELEREGRISRFPDGRYGPASL